MVNLESVCDKVEKDNELGIWDENQDYGKILYFSSSRILVKKMGKRWSHRRDLEERREEQAKSQGSRAGAGAGRGKYLARRRLNVSR